MCHTQVEWYDARNPGLSPQIVRTSVSRGLVQALRDRIEVVVEQSGVEHPDDQLVTGTPRGRSTGHCPSKPKSIVAFVRYFAR